jgi:hypothetical protein
MNKKALGVFVSLLAVAMLVLPMSAVSATKPEDIVAAFTTDILKIVITPIKGPTGKSQITILEMVGTDDQTWTGAISGVASYSGRWVAHGALGTGFVTHTGYYIFEDATVTVGDITATGGLVIKAAGNKPHEAGIWRVLSSDLVDSATDEPINLHGQGEIILQTMSEYDVVGKLHFDP